jgi:hypothetical protein
LSPQISGNGTGNSIDQKSRNPHRHLYHGHCLSSAAVLRDFVSGVSKAPKSKACKRDITMPDEVVEALRAYCGDQLELRMQPGQGRLPDDALLFAKLEGEPRSPSAVSRAWSDSGCRM